ncbi:MAG: exo-alpha-sialidase [Pirellulales bacterium]|nr:exo-alpha-sialidase [Pirellulales bacterium]
MRAIIAGLVVMSAVEIGAARGGEVVKLTLKSTEQSAPWKFASYLKVGGTEMIKGPCFYSSNNGQTWTKQSVLPDFDSNLPYGYRRSAYPLFVDPVNGNVIQLVLSLDTPGLDPHIVEPAVGEEAYYLRYRVSEDGGKTYLFDEPIIQQGKTLENPFDEVYLGKTGIYVGDSGSQIIRTRSGRMIIPAQSSKLGPDGKLWNPGGGWTYTDAVMILGSWQDDNRLRWETSEFIKGDPARSTRGMIEPTLADMPDGRLLGVMRGSNGGKHDPDHKIPSYKWYSVSTDDGRHWSKPKPWTYDDGKPFFSPSSMSQLLQHSSGRCFWIGNISPANSKENDPRYPLVIGEVNGHTLKLIKSTVLEIDTKRPDEPGVNLSHWWGLEDRVTHDIVIAGDRHSQGYKTSTPVTYRVSIQEPIAP